MSAKGSPPKVHYEVAEEGPLCDQVNAKETSALREHVTCKRCLSLLSAGVTRLPCSTLRPSCGPICRCGHRSAYHVYGVCGLCETAGASTPAHRFECTLHHPA